MPLVRAGDGDRMSLSPLEIKLSLTIAVMLIALFVLTTDSAKCPEQTPQKAELFSRRCAVVGFNKEQCYFFRHGADNPE